jgi:hypothetical protein
MGMVPSTLSPDFCSVAATRAATAVARTSSSRVTLSSVVSSEQRDSDACVCVCARACVCVCVCVCVCARVCARVC